VNSLTSLSPNSAKIPIHFETDRQVIGCALDSLAATAPREAKVIRIPDTLSLEKVAVSEAYAESLKTRKDLEALTSAAEIQFDTAGNLESPSAT
jgi:hypothetical protein